MKKFYATYYRKYPKAYHYKTGWEYVTKETTVEVMAETKMYAMVRYPGCMPFVVKQKELKKA